MAQKRYPDEDCLRILRLVELDLTLWTALLKAGSMCSKGLRILAKVTNLSLASSITRDQRPNQPIDTIQLFAVHQNACYKKACYFD